MILIHMDCEFYTVLFVWNFYKNIWKFRSKIPINIYQQSEFLKTALAIYALVNDIGRILHVSVLGDKIRFVIHQSKVRCTFWFFLNSLSQCELNFECPHLEMEIKPNVTKIVKKSVIVMVMTNLLDDMHTTPELVYKRHTPECE